MRRLDQAGAFFSGSDLPLSIGGYVKIRYRLQKSSFIPWLIIAFGALLCKEVTATTTLIVKSVYIGAG